MKRILTVVGSIAMSSLLGWLGAKVGIMTGFMLGTVGTGIGMYAGYRLAERLDS
jgi:dipeptide/tripeptide permease